MPTYLVPPRLPAGSAKERVVLCLATCLKVGHGAGFVGLAVQVERPCGVAVTTLPSPSAHLVSTCFLRLLAPPLTAAGVTWGPLLRHVRMAAGSVTAH